MRNDGTETIRWINEGCGMYDAAHTFAVPCSQAASKVVTSAGTLVLSLLITLGTQCLISIFIFPKSWITSNAMRRLLIVGSETLLFYLARFLTEQEEGIPSLLLGGANPARRPGAKNPARRPGATLSHRPVQGCLVVPAAARLSSGPRSTPAQGTPPTARTTRSLPEKHLPLAAVQPRTP